MNIILANYYVRSLRQLLCVTAAFNVHDAALMAPHALHREDAAAAWFILTSECDYTTGLRVAKIFAFETESVD